VKELFEAALGHTPAERSVFLDHACASDPQLRPAVESLLAYDAAGDRLLDGPSLPESLGLELGADGDLDEAEALGAYRLLSKIGEGGMGRVFLGERRDGTRRERVAIKVMRERLDSVELRRRFHVEREILASLEHPHIARLIAGGTSSGGAPFLVMELVDGVPITEHCDARRLSVRERLELFRRVCAAVHYAHQRLVVHRDIKPRNVLVAATGEPKLLDFGIAKVLASSTSISAGSTATTGRVLTPRYASPEHMLGQRITTASDVYSLGVLLYELLCGQLPFRWSGHTLQELIEQIERQQVMPPSRLVGAARSERPGASSSGFTTTIERIAGNRSTTVEGLRRQIAGDLDTIALRCLRADPADRFSSVSQLSGDLERHLAGKPIESRPASATYLLVEFVKRNVLAVSAAVMAATLVVLLAVVAVLSALQAARDRDLMEHEREKAEEVSRFLRESFSLANTALHPESPAKELTAHDILAHGARRLEQDFGEQPETRASLQLTLGGVYRALGDYSGAEVLVSAAEDFYRLDAEEPTLEGARAFRELGALRKDQGHHAAAVELAAEALDAFEQLPGTELDRIETLRLLVTSLVDAGELDRAELWARRAETLVESSLGGEHQQIAFNANALAQILYARGKEEQAVEEIRRAVAIQRRHPGSAYDLVQSLSVFTTILFSIGNYDEAEAAAKESLEVAGRLFEPGHPSVLEALHNLGSVLNRLARYAEAEVILRESLSSRRQVLGSEHPGVARSLNSLAISLSHQGRYEEAESLYRESLAIRRRTLGERHPAVATALHTLGDTLRELGRWDEAESLHLEGLALRRDSLGPEHPLVATSLYALGLLALRRDDHGTAETYFREALELREQVQKGDHVDLATSLVGLADVLLAGGRAEEALPLAERAAGIYARVHPPDHWHVAWARCVLGGTLLTLDRLEEAADLLAECEPLLRQVNGGDHRTSRAASRFRQLLADRREVGATTKL
jgi:serine/threonine-protein kinase